MNKQMKLTPNQSAVLETLSKSDKPLSAYEILNFENIRDSGIKAPLTVYRALDKLIDKGRVHRIESLNAFVACDGKPHIEPAGFVICESCKNTLELRIRDCEDHLTKDALKKGFQVKGIRVEVAGTCSDCQKS